MSIAGFEAKYSIRRRICAPQEGFEHFQATPSL
jgi:hypothetical protein